MTAVKLGTLQQHLICYAVTLGMPHAEGTGGSPPGSPPPAASPTCDPCCQGLWGFKAQGRHLQGPAVG